MSTTLTDGLSIMLIGMGTVLCFLCILILSMHIMSAIIGFLNKIFPEKSISVNKVHINKDDCIALAIAAAYNQK